MFDWPFGKKSVDYQVSNLGLRKHIIKCMNHVKDYNGLIMLEDDLLVSPQFYNYTINALDFTKNDDTIAGISLYKHEFNVHKTRNFQNVIDGYDNWFFQFASSWGQAWAKKHINDFLEWYRTEPELNHLIEIPKYVREWSEKSWLKYFIAYTIIFEKFFFYPSQSYSTNFGDQGSHMHSNSNRYQVPLDMAKNRTFNFTYIHNSQAIYDSFFESACLHPFLKLDKRELTVDLYGYKEVYSTPYLLTTKRLDFEILKSFGKELKPHELNIIYNVAGNDIFLYDTRIIVKNTLKEKRKVKDLLYDFKYISLKESFILFKENLFLRAYSILKRFY